MAGKDSKAPRSRINWRTPLLGTLMAATLAWSAVNQFDVPVEDIKHMLIMCLVLVGVIIVAAVLTVVVWKSISWLLSRGRD